MAELSEGDRRKLAGAAGIGDISVPETAVNRKDSDEDSRLDSLQMRRVFVAYTFIVAVVLIFAARVATTSTGMWTQIALAGAVAVLCAVYLVYLHLKLKEARRAMAMRRG